MVSLSLTLKTQPTFKHCVPPPSTSSKYNTGALLLLSVAGTRGKVAAITAVSICPRNSELGMHLIKCSRATGLGTSPDEKKGKMMKFKGCVNPTAFKMDVAFLQAESSIHGSRAPSFRNNLVVPALFFPCLKQAALFQWSCRVSSAGGRLGTESGGE